MSVEGYMNGQRQTGLGVNMRIATVSHSHIAHRQQWFFQEIAKQGHDVLMIAPGQWGNLRATAHSFLSHGGAKSTFDFVTCRHVFGDNLYTYRFLGAKEAIERFDPDWLYVQQEPGSVIATEAISWKAKKRAIFTWENIELRDTEILKRYDLVVCGNPDSLELVRPHNPNVLLDLQVGIDVGHFCARPGVERSIKVAYIGRRIPEKGLPYLIRAWPTVQLLDWQDYLMLPWSYSQVDTVVAYSQDVPHWKEQAPNYIALEALSCGCKVVTSDTSAMKYWLEGCPGVVVAEGHEQRDGLLRPERISSLRESIERSTSLKVGDSGRDFVKRKFSNKGIAEELICCLERFS